MNTPDPCKEKLANPDEVMHRHLLARMRWRGWLKVVTLTMAVDQLLIAVFTFAARSLDPGIGEMPTLIFSCITCMLVSNWLVSDARAAWVSAKSSGYIGTAIDAVKGESVVIAARCRRRWLVVLHIELNPQLVMQR
ncbi:hypothetical protein F4827_004136 [Paraburkholderia bannensis]|uniref:Uncharacterized protein n=1 Tax=Paraburkholderia bannensis TaxID=765414 RepID=A0A7W9WUD9_9BURK|nr:MULTISPECIES: hypothetical protein [Paraburkholderia]MBB3259261.1 hypothetical protein [Paraburkholderia sp. WP4_3_2]MBB6104277.1 hypothetical protein [Paraburkholderia bannensis]